MSVKNIYPDVLCFSHLRWNFVFQRPQHLMTRWARDHRVFFFEEPVFHDEKSRLVINRCSSGVYYATPYISRHSVNGQVKKDLRNLVSQLLTQYDISDYISWYYAPLSVAFTRHLTPLAVVYDCMDELSMFKGSDPLLGRHENMLFEMADLIFTGGYSLYTLKRQFHSNVHAFPSSVDVQHFYQARTVEDDPEDQRNIPHPRIGYYGVIDERIDLDLIRDVAVARPDWHLVMLGPVVKIDVESLPRLPNIHYLGQKNYEQLPLYVAGWDVAMMPFAKNQATRYISPTKTPEFLAAGKSVVSTSITDVVNPYGMQDMVRIADTAEQFELAIARCLEGEAPGWRRRTDNFIRGMSWDRTWGNMRRLVHDVIEEKMEAENLPEEVVQDEK